MDISESAAEDMCIMRLASFINETKLTELWHNFILLGSCMEVSSLMPHPLLLEELERRKGGPQLTLSYSYLCGQ